MKKLFTYLSLIGTLLYFQSSMAQECEDLSLFTLNDTSNCPSNFYIHAILNPTQGTEITIINVRFLLFRMDGVGGELVENIYQEGIPSNFALVFPPNPPGNYIVEAIILESEFGAEICFLPGVEEYFGCPCPDADNDTICDADDICPGFDDRVNTDGDTLPNGCDPDDDNDGVLDGEDCAPLNANIGAAPTWYADLDNDGAGDPNNTLTQCDQPLNYVAQAGDACPTDPNKTEPGICGCGTLDTDTDGDGIPDCNDTCNDTVDTDSDGVSDCDDQEVNSPCPENVDANGVSIDTDSDGTADCIDNCPNTSNPDQSDTNGDGTGDACENCADTDGDGVCNDADQCPGEDDFLDSDLDGIPDCLDNCPNDALKTEPGACGCGNPDTDSDNDGTPDCDDLCPNNPQKIDPGACGCENREDTSDRDGDGVPGCLDQENNSPCNGPGEVDSKGVSLDSDGDGVVDCQDVCIGTDLDQDGDKIPDCIDPNPYCRGDRIVICHVANNGSTKTLCISESQWARHLGHGDTIRDEPCPGAQLSSIEYEEGLTVDMNVYANPTSQEVNVELKNLQDQSNLRIYNLSGVQVYESTVTPGDSQTIQIHQRLSPGTYIIQLANDYERVSKKFIVEN